MHSEVYVFPLTGAMDGEVAEYLRQENLPYFDMQAAMYSHMEGNDALHVFVKCQVSSLVHKDGFEQASYSSEAMGLLVILQVI